MTNSLMKLPQSTHSPLRRGLRKLFATAALAAAIGGLGFGAAPALADEGWHHDHDRFEHREWREHEWREHEWREHHYWPVYGYGYVAPRYYYPPPPPVVYAPPPALSVVVPLNFR